jgi:hypothetical protein
MFRAGHKAKTIATKLLTNGIGNGHIGHEISPCCL